MDTWRHVSEVGVNVRRRFLHRNTRWTKTYGLSERVRVFVTKYVHKRTSEMWFSSLLFKVRTFQTSANRSKRDPVLTASAFHKNCMIKTPDRTEAPDSPVLRRCCQTHSVSHTLKKDQNTFKCFCLSATSKLLCDHLEISKMIPERERKRHTSWEESKSKVCK